MITIGNDNEKFDSVIINAGIRSRGVKLNVFDEVTCLAVSAKPFDSPAL